MDGPRPAALADGPHPNPPPLAGRGSGRPHPPPQAGEVGWGLAQRRRYGRAAGGAGAAAGRRGRRAPEPEWTADARRARLDRAGAAPGGRGLRRGRDRRPACRARRALRARPARRGAPSRGRPEVLPTGRNFYSLDTRAVPTPAAWQLGWKSASLLVERHAQEHGDYPRRVGALGLGHRQHAHRRRRHRAGAGADGRAPGAGSERPAASPASRSCRRACSTGRGSTSPCASRASSATPFPTSSISFDSAARAVAALDEPADVNPLAARVAADRAALEAAGVAPEDGARCAPATASSARKPGAYGAGLQTLIDERGWQDDGDLAEAYLAWGGYAYGAGARGRVRSAALFRSPARRGRGGAAQPGQPRARSPRQRRLLPVRGRPRRWPCGICRARAPAVYHNDHSRPEPAAHPHACDEEIGRVVRARAVNPKWIAGVMRHGYKGGFEMAATVDYLFAFAATARAVDDHAFRRALRRLSRRRRGARVPRRGTTRRRSPRSSARFAEAIERGLWRPQAQQRARGARSAMHERRAEATTRSTAAPREDGAAQGGARPRCSRPRPRSAASSSSIPAPARANRPPPSAWCCAASATACASASCSSSRARGRPASATCWRAFPISSPAARWARASPGTPRTAPATSPPRAPPGRRPRR